MFTVPIHWFSDGSVRAEVHIAVVVVAVVVGIQSLLLPRDADRRMATVTRTIVPRLEATGDLRGAQAKLNDAAARQIAGQLTEDATISAPANCVGCHRE
ncbi:hypothetical protein [Actinoplanes sp. NPDC049802]|uniref:hypothetical protein n=1 Tax=Actinoplanes sp. NPDC049802 TaxID=3154742 RepID=UPI0033F39FBD